MEVTSQEKETERRIIHGTLAFSIVLALMYLLAKSLDLRALYESLIHKFPKSIKGINKLFQWLSTNAIIQEPNLLLYLLLITLVLYGVMSRAKSRPGASRLEANVWLGASLVCFLVLISPLASGGGKFALQVVLVVGLITCFIRAANLFQSLFPKFEIDQFNEMEQSFPQTEELIQTPNSVNLAYDYFYKGWRRGYMNMLATTRGTLVLGTAGSGKTASILVPALWQSIYKGQSGVIYDFKYPNMSLEAYNALIKALRERPFAFGKKTDGQPIIPKFVSINFNDISLSARVNPIQPHYIRSLAQAQEVAKLLLTNLNRSWIGKESEFFNASAINLVTMAIYFLKLYSEKNQVNYCTIPHVVELVNQNIIQQMELYDTMAELRVLRSIFQVGLDAKATDQLGGQIASALNSLAPLSSKEVYWVLSGNDLELDINNPEQPVILCLGSDREHKNSYGALIAVLFSNIFQKMTKGQRPGFVMIDELPTIYLHDISYVINTIREIGVSVWLGIQDFAQLVADYKKEGADVVMNACGTILWGNVNFETAEKVSKIFGRTNQSKVHISIGAKDENSQYQLGTEQKDLLPPSLMTTLTPGRFAGKLADTHQYPLEQKLVYGDILLEDLDKDRVFDTLPLVNTSEPTVIQQLLKENYERMCGEVCGLVGN